jgi:ADP-ribose pyrophosphatase YjhB (NUDIX family)
MLPRKPGTYKFDFVIVTNNGRWACPTTEVEIKEPTSEAEERLISEFEQTGASAFLNHETGIRMAGDPDSQPVSYVALDAFVAVHPDSYHEKNASLRYEKRAIGASQKAGVNEAERVPESERQETT